jgi:hypothetical protein
MRMNNKRSKRLITVVVILCLTASAGVMCKKWLSFRALRMDVIKHFSFSKSHALKEWKEKVFKGKVRYAIDSSDFGSFVSAMSENAASALYYKVRLDIDRRPIISWKWNVKKFPEKEGSEDLKNSEQDDFGARVYVIFPAIFFTNTRAIEYIWTEKAKEGTISPSPYSKNLQLYVVESGKRENGGWVSEKRDIYNDYIEAFGEAPRHNIGAIAFMTDADSTGTSAQADYDDIKIGYKKEVEEEEKKEEGGDEQ